MQRTGRKIARLSALSVSRINSPGMHADGAGLYLLVGPNGAKSWIYRYRAAGRLHDKGLGPLHTVSLAEARAKALDCRKQRLDGVDPIESGKAKRQRAQLDAAKAMTFKACAERYIASHKAGWKNPKHAAQWPATLGTYVYPELGDLPIQTVDVGLVMKAVEPIWTEKPETASRVRGRIESVLDWATARGYRQGENPARWRGHLDQLLPKKSKVARAARRAKGKGDHFAAMPFQDLPAFMEELRERKAVAARALEFTILTVKRTEEVIGARWPEISTRDKLWTIPAGRMKGEREHRVPLSDAVLAVIEAMRPSGGDQAGCIFPGAKPARALSNMAMLNLLQKRMGRPDVTVHGFRSSFADWCSECTGFPAEVREMALAHVIDDKVEAAYRRGDLFDKRRELMAAWAKFAAAPEQVDEEEQVDIAEEELGGSVAQIATAK